MNTPDAPESAGRAPVATFDRAVLLALGFLLLLTTLLIWRGDRAGAPVEALAPADGAADVSTLARVSVRFGQPMDTDQSPAITIRPAITGTVRWQDNTLIFAPEQPLQPVTTYTVTVPAGVRSRSGRSLNEPLTWSFHTAEPRILFLSWDAQDRQQLYATTPQGAPPTQLTASEHGVVEYTVSPTGATIVYTEQRPDGGSDLRAVDRDGDNDRLLLDCTPDQCSGPVWAPDARRLLYERRRVQAGGGPPRLWWLDAETGDTVRLFQDDQQLGLAAAFSADGRWLAYVVPLVEEIRLVNLDTGTTLTVPSSTGETPIWAPHENAVVTSDVQIQGERFSIYLYRVTVPDGTMTNLSGDTETNDGAPSWSPDGTWLAFGRKVPRAPVGRQIWLMRPDGSERTPLTNDQEINYSRPLWSPDGTMILTQRFQITEPEADPGIWLLELDGARLHEVVTPGFQPRWLP